MDDHVVQCDNCGKEFEYRKGVYRIVYACGIEETGLMCSACGHRFIGARIDQRSRSWGMKINVIDTALRIDSVNSGYPKLRNLWLRLRKAWYQWLLEIHMHRLKTQNLSRIPIKHLKVGA